MPNETLVSNIQQWIASLQYLSLLPSTRVVSSSSPPKNEASSRSSGTNSSTFTAGFWLDTVS
jgi:hypothetical protein